MSFDGDLNACAALVEKGDPWRFRTVMAAPLEARKKLFPLYAFNVEVSRAAYVTVEPMIAEMRLQWWRDALEEIANGSPRRHEVVTPLADILTPAQATSLDKLVTARKWDCYKDSFEDQAELDTYLRNTSGLLMHTACELLGADYKDAVEIGFGLGVANWLRAIPELEAAHRIPLLDGTPAGISHLAEKGLEALAYPLTSLPKSARPAFWPAMGAARVLATAKVHPDRIANGTLPDIAPPLFALNILLGR